MHPYVVSLKTLFEAHANPSQAAPMKKYMRDQFEFLGIKTPERRELQKQFFNSQKLPSTLELKPILRDLWALPQREFQYAGIGLLGRLVKALPQGFTSTIEYLIITKPWWDTVDALASDIVGEHFHRFPKVREKYIAKWRVSNNFWLRRTCLLFQLGYKEATDFDLLCSLIRENLGSNEFFINKAISWALRQYARTNPQAVKQFVKKTPELHPLSRREAMKHLE